MIIRHSLSHVSVVATHKCNSGAAFNPDLSFVHNIMSQNTHQPLKENQDNICHNEVHFQWAPNYNLDILLLVRYQANVKV